MDWLEGIYNAIVGLWELVQTLGQFVVDFFSDLGTIAENLRNVVVNIPMYLSFFPTEIIVVLVGAVTVFVAYKIAGRS